MATWASRRRTVYASIGLILAIGLIGVPIFLYLYETPTCADGMMNQGEGGVDCGGPCPKLCRTSFLVPEVSWARSDKIATGVYNIAAYIVNPNVSGIARNVPYIFHVYDNAGILITEVRGTITLPPHKNVLAFEPGIAMAKRIPARTVFEFTGAPQWETLNTPEPLVSIVNTTLTNTDSGASLDTTLENRSLIQYKKLTVYAILYDEEGNTNGFARSYVDALNVGEKQTITFTWPTPREGEVTKREVVVVVGSRIGN